MAKQSARTATPRLRFPEFSDKPKWPVTKLGSRGKFIGGGTPSRANAEFWMGRHPWISSSDVSEEDIRSISPSRFITDEAVANSATQAVPTGSVLIVSRVGVGKIAVTQEQLYTSQDFASLVPSTDCPEFLAYLLKSRQSTLIAFNQGMAIKGFTRDDIAGLDVPIPDRAEQQKIADCLTSLDEVIAAQGRKVEALKAHKRGLMQQLFPREGETRPRLRFPEFRNAPEWMQGTLGGVCEVLNNRRIPISSGDRRPGPFPYYGASGVVDFVDHFIFDERLLLVGEDGAKWGAFEETAFIADGKYWVNNHAHVLKPSKVIDTLLASYLTMIDLAGYVTGHAPPKLTLAKLRSIAIVYPQSSSEQRRIADCVASLDTRIQAETDRLAALTTHKQGLMQQLFPAPEAMGA